MGKSRAMEFILTGNFFDAQEALTHGIVSKIFEPNALVEEAVKLGN